MGEIRLLWREAMAIASQNRRVARHARSCFPVTCSDAVKMLKSKVGEVMSTPAITLSPDKTVLDAAALMLKKKIHRIPILNEEHRVIDMVTRSDIFQALEAAWV